MPKRVQSVNIKAVAVKIKNMSIAEQEDKCLPSQGKIGLQAVVEGLDRKDRGDEKYRAAEGGDQDRRYEQDEPRLNDTGDASTGSETSLTEAQKKLLQQQHDVPDEKIPFSSLLQFTTGKERLLLAGSVFWAVASGIAFPAMSVRIVSLKMKCPLQLTKVILTTC